MTTEHPGDARCVFLGASRPVGTRLAGPGGSDPPGCTPLSPSETDAREVCGMVPETDRSERVNFTPRNEYAPSGATIHRWAHDAC